MTLDESLLSLGFHICKMEVIRDYLKSLLRGLKMGIRVERLCKP